MDQQMRLIPKHTWIYKIKGSKGSLNPTKNPALTKASTLGDACNTVFKKNIKLLRGANFSNLSNFILVRI